ncbi:MAG: hypothetical protein BRD38_01460 [Bacteroidetes bacterium QH_9_67_14]|nr:MAG: hypothetical protein BRD38_01460 [Bacteroidetes bacterium QH_9_67_14]
MTRATRSPPLSRTRLVKLLFRLLTLFLTVPVLELALLLQVSRWTGFWPTVALIAFTAIAGSYLAKREGLSAWDRLKGQLSGGGLPGDELLDAVIILVAGAFLITPGVLTDLVGFIGLIPLTRGWVRRLVKRRLKKAMREGRLQASVGAFGGTFDAGGSGASETSVPPEEASPADAASADEPTVSGTASARGPAPQSNEIPELLAGFPEGTTPAETPFKNAGGRGKRWVRVTRIAPVLRARRRAESRNALPSGCARRQRASRPVLP